MTKTRAERRYDGLMHLVENVFNEDISNKDNPFMMWITQNGTKSIDDLTDMKETDITIASFVNKNAEVTSLPPSNKGRIHILKAYLNWRRIQDGTFMKINDWLAVTEDMWNEFKSNEYATYSPLGQQVIGSTPAATNKPTSKPVDVIADFNKGVKRDATVYPKLQDDTEWDNWNRSIVSTARTQGLEDIINETYVPTTTIENDLFALRQNFMYDVFDKSLKTDYGKKIVCKHFEKANAQKVYMELKAHYTKSTKSKHIASGLLEYITSAKIGDGKWKGTAQGFIIHWQEQVRKYDKLMDDPVDQFSATIKTTLLQNAVADLECLRAVKDNEDHTIARGGARLDYDKYTDLVISAATNHDIHLEPKSKMKSSNRGIYNTEIKDHVNNNYDIDSTVNMIQVNFTRTSSMPKSQWDN